VTEKTIGNPSEKDFAAHGIAVRDFGMEAAEKWKRERLRVAGWETPGFEGEGQGASVRGSRKGKGKGKRVVRKLSVVAEEDGTQVHDEEAERQTVMGDAQEDTKGKGQQVEKGDGSGEN
jgi:hypothetical protein